MRCSRATCTTSLQHEEQPRKNPAAVKTVIHGLADLRYKNICRIAFKELNILTVIALYITEAIMYAVSTDQSRSPCYTLPELFTKKR